MSVALLRIVLAEPEAVLIDEPFSKLDTPLRAGFRDFVREQIVQLAIPALLVTDDEEDNCSGIICRLGGEEDR